MEVYEETQRHKPIIRKESQATAPRGYNTKPSIDFLEIFAQIILFPFKILEFIAETINDVFKLFFRRRYRRQTTSGFLLYLIIFLVQYFTFENVFNSSGIYYSFMGLNLYAIIGAVFFAELFYKTIHNIF